MPEEKLNSFLEFRDFNLVSSSDLSDVAGRIREELVRRRAEALDGDSKAVVFDLPTKSVVCNANVSLSKFNTMLKALFQSLEYDPACFPVEETTDSRGNFALQVKPGYEVWSPHGVVFQGDSESLSEEFNQSFLITEDGWSEQDAWLDNESDFKED